MLFLEVVAWHGVWMFHVSLTVLELVLIKADTSSFWTYCNFGFFDNIFTLPSNFSHVHVSATSADQK